MNVDPSVAAFVVAISVGVATIAGAVAASLIIEATKGDIHADRAD